MTEPTAVEIAADLAAGKVTALAVTEACLARIAADEPRIQAFAHLDPEHARAQARALDDRKRAGRALGALHGVPVAVKDIVDTADFPTEQGSVIHAGRRPLHDAVIVTRLRAAGAILLGKTVTTEFACFTPGKTRTRTTLSVPQVARRAARRPPWPQAWRQWQSAARPTAR